MSRTTTPTTSDPKQVQPPLASVAGLLTGCAVTLIGVISQLSPQLILVRALIAGCVAFCVMFVMVSYWRHVSPKHDEE